MIQSLFHIIFFFKFEYQVLGYFIRNLNSYSKMLWFYFIFAKYFFKICSSKSKRLDNLDFFENFSC